MNEKALVNLFIQFMHFIVFHFFSYQIEDFNADKNI